MSPAAESGRLELPVEGAPDDDELLSRFGDWVSGRGLTMYPAQEEAVVELLTGAHVVLGTPTGSGKSLVATAAHWIAAARGGRTVYTAPIKALVSEKFFALCEVFGAQNVGMATGDASVNPGAPIICCTAEVLANRALREGAEVDVDVVVMDEFHYYGDRDRGWAWQVPLIEMTGAQFLLMSATLGDTTRVRERLTRATGRPTALVASMERPVPLHHEYAMTPIHETIEELVATGQAPAYVVHPTQLAALERAQALTSVTLASRERRDRIADTIGDFRFSKGFGTTLSRLVRHGVGVHHAGMLPRYRRLVERLAQEGLLTVVCGTDTLGVGINVPIRTVVFSGLVKYDGRRDRKLTAREFHQIAGRAGRAGYDTAGTVMAQAPEHEIENARLVAKAGDDVKKQRKIQRRKAPEGAVSWSRATFERLVEAEPEPLRSRFVVTTSMVVNVIARPGDAVATMRHLLWENDDPPAARLQHVRDAVSAYRSLRAAGVVEELAEPDERGRRIRLTVDLQADFALDAPLSPFALAAVELLDVEADDYAADVVSVVEATLDDPRPVITAQRSRARGEAVAQMKAEGIEYEERMELLEEVTHPQPLAELLEVAYESYRQGHPWIADHELKPKAVVREMWERAMTFSEYVSSYGLARSEGILLRYLAGAHHALRRGVPDERRTDELRDLLVWLKELVRSTDSSLIEEWSALTAPSDDIGGEVRPTVPVERSIVDDPKVFAVMVRTAAFRRVDLAARGRVQDLAGLDPDGPMDAPAWHEALSAYREEYDVIGTGPAARGPLLHQVEHGSDVWTVRQVFDDPAGDHDWGFIAEVDLAASAQEGEPVVRVVRCGPFTSFQP